MVVVAMVSRKLLHEEPEAQGMQSAPVTDRDQIEIYVMSSIKNAFVRVSGFNCC